MRKLERLKIALVKLKIASQWMVEEFTMVICRVGKWGNNSILPVLFVVGVFSRVLNVNIKYSSIKIINFHE